MRVKKFVAESLKSATDRMRAELGPEAIVLSTRSVPRGGMLSFVAKDMIEITAAIDDLPLRPQAGTGSLLHGQEAYRAAAGTRRPAPPARLRSAGDDPDSRVAPVGAEVRLLREDVDGLRTTLREIAGYMKHSRMPSLPALLADAYSRLVASGIDTGFAAEITQAVYRKTGDAGLDDPSVVTAGLRAALAAAFTIAPPPSAVARRTVVLVGPTGVGKTTTIAKLAALDKLTRGRALGLVSADTYRIGAMEQLRTFAGIADIPMEVAYEPADIPGVLETFRDRDVVYVDTVGRSQRGAQDLTDLLEFIEAVEPDEVHLVLSAATGFRTQREVVERFRVLGPNRLLFTKLDETATPGTLARIAADTGLPVAWVTTGQTVPDDIVPADADLLAGMILTGVLPNA